MCIWGGVAGGGIRVVLIAGGVHVGGGACVGGVQAGLLGFRGGGMAGTGRVWGLCVCV